MIFCNYDYNLYLVVDTFETSSFVIPSIYVLACVRQWLTLMRQRVEGAAPHHLQVDLPVDVVRILDLDEFSTIGTAPKILWII